MENRWSKEFQEAYEKALENAEKHPENYNDVFAGYENDLQKALSLIELQEDRIKRLEAQIELILRSVSNKDFPISAEQTEAFWGGSPRVGEAFKIRVLEEPPIVKISVPQDSEGGAE